MNKRTASASVLALVFGLSYAFAYAGTPLSVSCAGAPAGSTITWTASASGGVAPYALLWSNGATSSSQAILYVPGTYSMNIQATDASSTVATSTCAALIAQPIPTIASFTATPLSITSGQSATLSWAVSNASSTSLSGIGIVTGSSAIVSPAVTTTYTLTAVNSSGTSTAQATVSVNAASTTPSVSQQIEALLQQIRALQQQIAQIVAGQFTGGGAATSTPAVIPPGQVGKALCVVLDRDLQLGDRGDDVRDLQQALIDEDDEDGEDDYHVSATGFFGPLTEEALKHVQEKYGIVPAGTGFAGPLTRGFFEHRCDGDFEHADVHDHGEHRHSHGNNNHQGNDDN